MESRDIIGVMPPDEIEQKNHETQILSINIEDAHRSSLYNKDDIAKSDVCGCFYCLGVFEPIMVADWVDGHETAICPLCGVDSVIASASGFPIKKSFLKKMKKVYF